MEETKYLSQLGVPTVTQQAVKKLCQTGALGREGPPVLSRHHDAKFIWPNLKKTDKGCRDFC